MACALLYIPECCTSVVPGRLQAASSTVAVHCGRHEGWGAPAARAECLAVAGVLVVVMEITRESVCKFGPSVCSWVQRAEQRGAAQPCTALTSCAADLNSKEQGFEASLAGAGRLAATLVCMVPCGRLPHIRLPACFGLSDCLREAIDSEYCSSRQACMMVTLCAATDALKRTSLCSLTRAIG